MHSLLQDFRYAVRMLARSPGFTLVAVLSLTLGIGVNATAFTLVNAVLLRTVPAADPARAVTVYTLDPAVAGDTYLPTSHLNLRDYRQKNTVFSSFSEVQFAGLTWTSGAHKQALFAELVNPEFFPTLGLPISLGRNFLPEEDGAPGAHPVAILSHGLWVRQFGGSAGAIGQTIALNGLAYTVIGVAPADMDAMPIYSADLWIPMAMHDQALSGLVKEWFNQRERHFGFGVARLKPGVTLPQARAAMHALASALAAEYPVDDTGQDAALVPLSQSNIAPNARPAFLLAGTLLGVIAGLVLLIACANVANLLLVRATRRNREMAVRQALGAGRARLIRQLLTESLLLGGLAGVAALGFAYLARSALWALRPPGFGNGLSIALNGRVLAFTFVVALFATALFGVAPALRATREASVAALRDRTELPAGSLRWYGLRGMLVMVQIAFSLIALIGASLFLHSLENVQRVDLGFDAPHLIVLATQLQSSGYTPPRALQFYQEAAARLRAQPQVAAAGVTDTAPFTGGTQLLAFPGGADTHDPRRGKLTPVSAVGPGYFSAMGIRLLRGRDLSDDDTAAAPWVAVVNDTLANRLWPGQNPLGQHLRFFQQSWDVTVVGEVSTAKYATLGEAPTGQAYFSLAQRYGPAVVLVRTVGDPAAAEANLRGMVRGLDAALPPVNASLERDNVARLLAAPRLGAELLAVFGVLALLLAAVGTYGVMSYSVNQRVREIGIRIALGAGRADVLRLILGSGLAMVLAGTAAGLVFAALLHRSVAALLFGIGGLDWASFGAASALLLAMALVACWLPARRAQRVDPMIALRCE